MQRSAAGQAGHMRNFNQAEKQASKSGGNHAACMATDTHLETGERRRKVSNGLVYVEVDTVHCDAAIAASKPKLAPCLGQGLEDRAETESTTVIDTTCDASLESFLNRFHRLGEMSVFRITRETGNDTLADIDDRKHRTFVPHCVSNKCRDRRS